VNRLGSSIFNSWKYEIFLRFWGGLSPACPLVPNFPHPSPAPRSSCPPIAPPLAPRPAQQLPRPPGADHLPREFSKIPRRVLWVSARGPRGSAPDLKRAPAPGLDARIAPSNENRPRFPLGDQVPKPVPLFFFWSPPQQPKPAFPVQCTGRFPPFLAAAGPPPFREKCAVGCNFFAQGNPTRPPPRPLYGPPPPYCVGNPIGVYGLEHPLFHPRPSPPYLNHPLPCSHTPIGARARFDKLEVPDGCSRAPPRGCSPCLEIVPSPVSLHMKTPPSGSGSQNISRRPGRAGGPLPTPPLMPGFPGPTMPPRNRAERAPRPRGRIVTESPTALCAQGNRQRFPPAPSFPEVRASHYVIGNAGGGKKASKSLWIESPPLPAPRRISVFFFFPGTCLSHQTACAPGPPRFFPRLACPPLVGKRPPSYIGGWALFPISETSPCPRRKRGFQRPPPSPPRFSTGFFFFFFFFFFFLGGGAPPPPRPPPFEKIWVCPPLWGPPKNLTKPGLESPLEERPGPVTTN